MSILAKDAGDNSAATPDLSYRLPNGLLLFRWTVISIALLLLLINLTTLYDLPPFVFLALFATILCARAVPVALAREKPITFCAAFVFAGSLLLSGAAAGLGAILAYTVHARLFQKGGRRYALFLGAQYAISAFCSQALFRTITGRPNVFSASITSISDELPAICASAVIFVGINGLLVGIGNLDAIYARRAYAEPVFRAQALSYAISFPYGVLLICAYGAFGITALPVMAGLLLIFAYAVRMTVENRSLKRLMAAMEDLGKSCAAEVREEAPLQKFLQLARDLLAFDHAVLWLEDEDTAELQARAFFPLGGPQPEEKSARLDTLLARVTRRTDPILVAHVSQYGDPDGPAGEPISELDESWILYPLILHGRCIGAAQFVRRAQRPFTRVEMERLATLVPQAAISFEGARVRYLMHQYHEMMRHYQDMAQTDGLTGLYNHRRSQELLRDEMARAARYQRPLSVLMLDVDFFKQYNDAYGHPQGDGLLRSIAHILKNSVRMTDHVGRYGGEEFIILLPETAGSDGFLLAERIREAVESARFAAGEGWVVQKTISIGMAAYPFDATTPAEMLQMADAALYRAKHTGKNCVVMADRGELVEASAEGVRV